MIPILPPEISATAGPGGDGIFVGQVAQTPLTAAFLRATFSQSLHGLRKDALAGSVYAPVTLSSATGATVQPFGAALVAADMLFIAPDDGVDICQLYVEVLTPGVYAGDGIEMLESLDGETLTPVTTMTDGSNGFRAAVGIYKIDFSVGARKAFSPEFGGTKRKYVVIRPKNLGAVTTTPVLGRVWGACPEEVMGYYDFTGIYNGGMTDGDFSAVAGIGDILAVEESHVVIGLPDRAMWLDLAQHQGIRGDIADPAWEYYNGSAWQAFADIADGSDGFSTGPATLGDPVVNATIKWSVPAVWPKAELSFAIVGEATPRKVAAHWVRMRPDVVRAYEPGRSGRFRMRGRCYGAGRATGIYVTPATSLSQITFEGVAVPAATDVVVEMHNGTTGAASTITIPAGSLASYSLTGGRLAFSSPLAFNSGDHLIASHVSGGSITGGIWRIS